MYIYKVINKKNGKIYIGQSTKSVENSKWYLGSGVYLCNAIKKHGSCNFIKEIIEKCESQIELNEREQFWISYFNSTNKSVGYNLMTGGGQNGTHTGETRKKLSESHMGISIPHTEETKEIIRLKAKERYKNKTNHPRYKTKHTKETREKMKLNHADFSNENNPMSGKSVFSVWVEKYGYDKAKELEEDTNKKKSESHKGKSRPDISERTKGHNNPAYGRKWMNNGKKVIYIKKEDVNKYIELGYIFGKKLLI